MGLDMYARSFPKGKPFEELDDCEDYLEIHYWRKHNRLMGWMTRLYESKGGTEEFNCRYVKLEIEDLLRLQKDITNGSNLEPTDGFFFGGNYKYDSECKKDDLMFVAKALAEIADDRDVYFSAWY